MISRCKAIWSRTKLHLPEISLIYGVQLLCYAIAFCAAYQVMHAYLGQSKALDRLADGFDRTVFMDIFYRHDGVLDPLVHTFVYIIFSYMICSLVLQGGLLSNIVRARTGISSQVRAGFRHVISLALLSITAIAALMLWAALILVPFSIWVGDPLSTFHSEKPFVWWIITLVGLLSLIGIYVWAWAIAAKSSILQGRGLWVSCQYGLKMIYHHKGQVFAIGYLFIALHLLVAWAGFWLLGDRGAASWWIVAYGLLMRQIFVGIRIWLRAAAYVTLAHLDKEYTHHKRSI